MTDINANFHAITNIDMLLNRIGNLEGIVDNFNVEDFLSHLYELYQEYVNKKLMPFTVYA